MFRIYKKLPKPNNKNKLIKKNEQKTQIVLQKRCTNDQHADENMVNITKLGKCKSESP